MWFAVLAALVADLFVRDPWGYSDGYHVSAESVHASTYLFLIGIAALGFFSVEGRRLAVASDQAQPAKLGIGFGTVAVIISLIIGVIYGFACFMSGFNGSAPSGTQHNELVRILGVYLPILLDAGLLVFLILRAFVGQHKEAEDD
jgi:heme/copper-type cytochrome/quinol oxidase subunit 2